MWWWRCCLWLFDDLTLAISVNRPQQQQWTVHFYLFRVPHIKTGVPQIYLLFHKDSLHTYFDKVAALLSTTMSSYSNSKYLTLSLPAPQLFSLDKTNRQNCVLLFWVAERGGGERKKLWKKYHSTIVVGRHTLFWLVWHACEQDERFFMPGMEWSRRARIESEMQSSCRILSGTN